MVASPEENNYFLIFRYKLEPEIYSINTILKLIENIEKHKAHITFPIKIREIRLWDAQTWLYRKHDDF